MTGQEALSIIKLYMIKHSLTQRAMAYIVGTDETTLSRWVRWGKVGRRWMVRLEEQGFFLDR